jgi:hypothetical protein
VEQKGREGVGMSNQTQNWQASAERHEKQGEPVAALISRNLAYQIEQAKAEEAQIKGAQ